MPLLLCPAAILSIYLSTCMQKEREREREKQIDEWKRTGCGPYIIHGFFYSRFPHHHHLCKLLPIFLDLFLLFIYVFFLMFRKINFFFFLINELDSIIIELRFYSSLIHIKISFTCKIEFFKEISFYVNFKKILKII